MQYFGFRAINKEYAAHGPGNLVVKQSYYTNHKQTEISEKELYQHNPSQYRT